MNAPQPAPPFKEHHFRHQLYGEIHSRPFPLVESPASATHLAVINGDCTRQERVAHLAELANHFSISAPDKDANCYYQRLLFP